MTGRAKGRHCSIIVLFSYLFADLCILQGGMIKYFVENEMGRILWEVDFVYFYIQGVAGGMCQTSGQCSLR